MALAALPRAPLKSSGLLALVMWCATCTTPQPPRPRAILSKPPTIERSEPVTQVPIEMRLQKLFVPATVNGQRRSFIFDTGSPTMLSRAFAETLGLRVVSKNTGRDANGKAVTMDVAVVDTLSLGGVTFRQVPVLVFDFGQIEMGDCVFDGGVIGSEIFPGSVWRIDTENARLEIAATKEALSSARAPVLTHRLEDFGYPHAPIVGYEVGAVKDKALFDTGNAGQVVLFERVAKDSGVQKEMTSRMAGRGSDGVSAGGQGAERDLVRFGLPSFRLGPKELGPVRATTRPTPPTLVGAGLLGRFVVTLDYVAGRFLLEARETAAPAPPEVGYGVSFVKGEVRVTRLFEGSAAAKAGVRLGDRVRSINGRAMTGLDASKKCEAFLWMGDGWDRAAEATLVVEREGQEQTLRVPASE